MSMMASGATDDVSLAAGTVAARVFGPGRPVVVLFHSLLADRTSFLRITDALAADMTVVLPELPGFGGSAAVVGGLPVVADRMAEAVADAASRFGDGSKPVVLGNGYGGFVALQMVLRHPGVAGRLVVADAGAAFSEPGREAFRGMSRGAAAKGLEAVADTAMRRLFAADFHAANPELVAERRASFLSMNIDVFHQACADLAALDLRPQLAGLDLPVFVTVGSQDEATPPPMSHELAAGVAGARLMVLEGLAHVPQLQAPELFVAAVLPFLTGSTVADTVTV
jgi:3-oxoadipate enol-lactonase